MPARKGDRVPNVFGEDLYSIPEFMDAFRKHGDKVRGAYVVRYQFGGGNSHPYQGASMRRPPALAKEDPHAVYPWEQLLMAAANCAGSDYPILADYWGIPLEAVEVEFTAVFDPRGEFGGLERDVTIPDGPRSYQSFHWAATLTSSAPKADLERLHRRALSNNMVLTALAAVPMTDSLKVVVPGKRAK